MGFRERWESSTALTKTILAITPAIGAFLGAIAAAPAAYEAWDNFGLPTVAMRAYVRSEVSPVKAAQSQSSQKINDL